MRILLLLLLFISGNAWACTTPSSTYTYVSGNVILPNQVQTNENNLYSYVQTGVCQYQSGSITQGAISSTAGILYSQLNLGNSIVPTDINTSVTSNVYQFENLTIPSTGNFVYGTQHQGDVLYDNGTTFTRLTPGTSGKVLQTQGNSANPQWAYPSGQLGTWVGTPTYVSNTAYQAATDGFFMGYNEASSVATCYTDSSVTPSTTRMENAAAKAGCFAVVRKGDYWEVSSNNTVFFISLGS